MKTKNALIASLAFIVALGSAFGNLSTSQAGWVLVRFWGSSVYNCVNTGFECNENGPLTCKIYVETISGSVIVNARRDIACAVTLNSNSNIPIGFYDPPLSTILSTK